MKTPYPLCQKGRRRSPAAFDVSVRAKPRNSGWPDRRTGRAWRAGGNPERFIAQSPKFFWHAACILISGTHRKPGHIFQTLLHSLPKDRRLPRRSFSLSFSLKAAKTPPVLTDHGTTFHRSGGCCRPLSERSRIGPILPATQACEILLSSGRSVKPR